ncbi:sodium-dependent phosphate transporter 1-like [Lingula anatina]|uniref:Phosphate transporter n=1 Tax=Lingula anatina TaxID=7574 RepID=A0A1S3HI33_LINAN|nr:sodium-dependent phosphate transporter 1-like [Lingula anatina]|eukprot:XP_013385768.1 sodium-dependent phosphate transporter 1-like [Lingula anatina]
MDWSKVSDTIRKGIIDVMPYNGTEDLLMLGNVCALSGSCIWLLVATFFSMPVSGTHSIVGATMGFALVAHGAAGVNWKKIGMIIASWFVSPILSGLVSVGVFFFVYYFILSKPDPLLWGMRFLPLFYGATLTINLFSVFYEGPQMLYFHLIPIWGTFSAAFGGGLVCALLVWLFLVPWQRRRIIAQCAKERNGETEDEENQIESDCSNDPKTVVSEDDKEAVTKEKQATEVELKQRIGSASSSDSGERNDFSREDSLPHSPSVKPLLGLNFKKDKDVDNESVHSHKSYRRSLQYEQLSIDEEKESARKEEGRENIQDSPEAAKLFYALQILTAVFGSFAHGGNDVSNAIGPVVALWIIGIEGEVHQKMATPIWILFYGGLGISLGLWVWGRRVIKTLGDDLTKITPSSGFCIEIASALTVLVASNIGIPISTTHCKVGSIVGVGRFRSRENVDWKLFRNIFFAWIVTVPVSGAISAAMFAGLRLAL